MCIPVRLRRAGKEMRLVVDDGSEQPPPDPALIRLVIRAHGIRDQLLQDRSLTLEEIARSHRFFPSYAIRFAREGMAGLQRFAELKANGIARDPSRPDIQGDREIG